MQDHPSGSTLPAEIRLFRFEVVERVLSGSKPLSKVDTLRPILEKRPWINQQHQPQRADTSSTRKGKRKSQD